MLQTSAANMPPTANAGPSQSVAAASLVTLDGTGSSDPDGTIVSYAWIQTVGTTVTLSNAGTATPVVGAPSSLNAETLTFQLTVTDDGGATATDTVDVAVAARAATNWNQIQLVAGAYAIQFNANATGHAYDQGTRLGQHPNDMFTDTTVLIRLNRIFIEDISGEARIGFSDLGHSGNAETAYAILDVQGSLYFISETDQQYVQIGIAPRLGSSPDLGSWQSDSWSYLSSSFATEALAVAYMANGNWRSDDVIVALMPTRALLPRFPNIPPTANAGNDQSVAAGASVTLDGTGSNDLDGTIVSYAWVQTSGDTVALTDAATATPDFTAPSTPNAQSLTFRLTVTDDDGATATATVDVGVAAALAAPRFVDDTGDAQSWTAGIQIAPITVPAAVANPTPTYAVIGTLPTGILFNQNSRVISGTPTAFNSGTITIRATNSQGSADWTVTYTTTAGLAAPSFADNTGDPQDWFQGTTITPIVVPLANGNPAPSYNEVGSLPAGISFNRTTRIINGTPTTLNSGTITIEATNSEGSADWTVTYTTRASLNAPSFVDSTGDAQSWLQGTAITPLTMPAAIGNPTPTYAVVGNLPAGIAFNTGNRRITGTPTAVGNGTIRIRATNNQGTADWTVTYTTTVALGAPNFANDTGTPQNWMQNQAITQIIVPQATGNPTPTYSAVGTLPSGIAFSATTRVISGTPNSTGKRNHPNPGYQHRRL